MSQSLIKSKDRVRDVGEVFTPPELVEAMLNQFPKDAWKSDRVWLEPTCGNGNFVIAILRRKLKKRHSLEQALNTTFGFDIMPDNVIECHKRIYNDIVFPYLCSRKRLTKKQAIDIVVDCVCIVETNIRHTEDTLKENLNEIQSFDQLPTEHVVAMSKAVRKMVVRVFDGKEYKGNNPGKIRVDKELSVFRKPV